GSCALLERGDVMCWPNATNAVPGAIRLGPGGPPSSGPIPVLALADVKLRYTPTPAELAGTEWSACLERCDTCRYTLRFQARGEFVAARACEAPGEALLWTGNVEADRQHGARAREAGPGRQRVGVDPGPRRAHDRRGAHLRRGALPGHRRAAPLR